MTRRAFQFLSGRKIERLRRVRGTRPTGKAIRLRFVGRVPSRGVRVIEMQLHKKLRWVYPQDGGSTMRGISTATRTDRESATRSHVRSPWTSE